MLIIPVNKNKIIKEVRNEIADARKEIFATMLMSDELGKPLPESYHRLLQKKTEEGIYLNRLGFGTKEEYNQINKNYTFTKNYKLVCVSDLKEYQRLIIIDREIVFFAIENRFFKSTYSPIIRAFLDYFESKFKEG